MISANIKAVKLIAKLQRIIADSERSGFISDQISMEEKYQLSELTRQLSVSIHKMDISDPVLRIDRLRVFAKHLDKGNLVHKFKGCDSTYFAEYPILFPEHWKAIGIEIGSLNTQYLPLDCSPYDGEMFFFGLTELQHNHLFFSYNWNNKWGDIRLTDRSGRYTYVKRINQFCDYFEKGGEECA